MKILDFILNNKEYSQDLITKFVYHSNGIEGSTLTYAETYAILYNDNSFKIQGKEPREIYEAINHKVALEMVFDELKKKDSVLTSKMIIDLNTAINKNIKEVSGYRKVTVIINGTDYIPPAPEKIPNLMNYYIYNYNNDVNDIYTKLATYHIEFESIHPFEDGNGRTGRLLLNYELLKNNLAPIVISKEDRVKYYEFLRNNDIKGMAKWFEELSYNEEKRMIELGYKK